MLSSLYTLGSGFLQVLFLLVGVFCPPAFLCLLIASLILNITVPREKRIKPLMIILYISMVITFVMSVIGIVSLVDLVNGIGHM